MRLAKPLWAKALQQWEMLAEHLEVRGLLQQSEVPIVKDVPHPPWHTEVTGLKVKRLCDRRLDAEWWVADDSLVAHARPACPHLEQQLVHHIEVVHEHRLALRHALAKRPRRQLVDSERVQQLVRVRQRQSVSRPLVRQLKKDDVRQLVAPPVVACTAPEVRQEAVIEPGEKQQEVPEPSQGWDASLGGFHVEIMDRLQVCRPVRVAQVLLQLAPR